MPVGVPKSTIDAFAGMYDRGVHPENPHMTDAFVASTPSGHPIRDMVARSEYEAKHGLPPDPSNMMMVHPSNTYGTNARIRDGYPTDSNVLGFHEQYGQVAPGVQASGPATSESLFEGATPEEQAGYETIQRFEAMFGKEVLYDVLEELMAMQGTGAE